MSNTAARAWLNGRTIRPIQRSGASGIRITRSRRPSTPSSSIVQSSIQRSSWPPNSIVASSAGVLTRTNRTISRTEVVVGEVLSEIDRGHADIPTRAVVRIAHHGSVAHDVGGIDDLAVV